MEFLNSVIEEFGKGTAWAILIGLVGALWQGIYNYNRDRFRDNQAKDEFILQEKRFAQQAEIEKLRFEHEKIRWREELSIQMTLKLLDVRLAEYAPIWTHISTVARNMMDAETLTPDLARELATKIKDWRYAKGGLLAAEATRVAAYDLQQLLWEFDGTHDSFERIHHARRLFRNVLRADMGLDKNAPDDPSIIDKVFHRQTGFVVEAGDPVIHVKTGGLTDN